jgi:hypothetical protein
MPAISAFADILDKAADLLTDATVTSDELCKRGLPGQSGDENKLLTRTRDQAVKMLGESDDLRWNVGIFLKDLSQPLRPNLSLAEREYSASQFRGQAENLREFVVARRKKAKELRRLRKLAGNSKRCGKQERTPAAPVQYLTNWREILVALGMKSNKEDREKVRNLNVQYGGPIVIPRQGAQPKVDKAKLVAWWNGLEAQWTVGYQRARDAKPTTDAQHPYGRNGTLAPEISGGVRKRRRDRQA